MFRWKRALLHGLIPFGVVMVVGLVLVLATDVPDPEKFGEGVGRFVVFAYLGGLGISYLAQTGRKRAALAASLAIVAAIGAIVAVAVSNVPRGKPLRAIDREPLVEVDVAGKHRLRHPTFGFSILRPPASFTAHPELASQLAAVTGDARDSVHYAFTETSPSGGVLVTVMANVGTSRDDFDEVVRGVRKGLEKSGASVKLDRDEITGDGDQLAAHIAAVANGIHVRMEAHALPARSAIVMITVFDLDGTSLTDVLTSFSNP
jgi:hypothetical protein